MRSHANLEPINFPLAFNFGWEIVKKHWFFLLQIWFIVILICGTLGAIETAWFKNLHFFSDSQFLLFLLFELFYWVTTITLSYNFIKINLNILHNKQSKTENISELFRLPTLNTLNYLATLIVYTFLVFFGLIFFIIPGIYFGLKYFYVTTLVIDKKLPILTAAKQSAEMMKNQKWQMFAYLLIMCVTVASICVVGFIFLVIGIIPAMFISVWIFTFANLWVYNQLLKE